MAKHDNCKADGCNTIVSDDNDFCRSCRAKQAVAAQDMKMSTEVKTDPQTDPLDLEIDALLPDDFGLLDVADPAKVAQRRLQRIQRPPASPEYGYLPFPRGVPGNGSDWHLVAQPQLLFKPMALMLWGFNDDSVITGLYIGQRIQGAASCGELPASFFGTAKSYEKLLEDLTTNGISPPNWITWSTVHVGQNVSITGRGALRHAVMLGKMAY